MIANEMVMLRGIKMPELENNRQINEIKALTFDRKRPYDVILGKEFLS